MNDTQDKNLNTIAEELVEYFPEFVTRDKDGNIYGVRYDELNRLMLYAFQDVHAKYEEQKEETRLIGDQLLDVLDKLDKYERLDEVLSKFDIDRLAHMYKGWQFCWPFSLCRVGGMLWLRLMSMLAGVSHVNI